MKAFVLVNERTFFKYQNQTCSLLEDGKLTASQQALDILIVITRANWSMFGGCFLNKSTAHRIFMTKLISSKLKLTTNYLGFSMGQGRLSNLAILKPRKVKPLFNMYS